MLSTGASKKESFTPCGSIGLCTLTAGSHGHPELTHDCLQIWFSSTEAHERNLRRECPASYITGSNISNKLLSPRYRQWHKSWMCALPRAGRSVFLDCIKTSLWGDNNKGDDRGLALDNGSPGSGFCPSDATGFVNPPARNFRFLHPILLLTRLQ